MLFEDLIETPFDAEIFYKRFTPILKDISVPENLASFAECLSTYHSLDLNISLEPKVISEPREGGDKRKVIILFSGGIDSAWAALWALDQGLSPHALFVDGFNKAQNSRERVASKVLCEKMGIPYLVYNHPSHLKTLHKGDSNIFKIPESLVRLQYALMAVKDYILNNNIAGVVSPTEPDEPEYIDPTAPRQENGLPLTWFQDSEKSIQAFLPFLSDYIGWDFQGYYPFALKEDRIKVLMEKGLFEDTCSCVCNPVYFAGHRKRSAKAPRFTNMCGVCWKCREVLAFMSKANL